MLNDIMFSVRGTIVGKQRPRFRRVKAKGKEFISTYTPKKTKNYEELVAESYQSDYPFMVFPEGALELEVEFFFKMPDSWSKKKRIEMYDKPCTKRPDIDNCIKSIQDGLNGIAFTDDSQITDLGHCIKRWATQEYTIIKIKRILAQRS